MTTETSIYEYAKQGLALSADKPAIWFYGKCITYRELFEKIDNVADHLYALGVRDGTVVTINLPNCPQAVMAIYAVAKLGGICNMVHALHPIEMLKENMEETDSSFLITYQAEYCVISETSVFVDVSRYMGFLYKIGYRITNKPHCPRDAVPFKRLEKGCEAAVVPKQSGLGKKCVFYLQSTGTSGKPKIVMQSHEACNNWESDVDIYYNHVSQAGKAMLCVLPLFHGSGLVLDMHHCVVGKMQQVLMAKFSAKEAIRLMKKHKIAVMTGIPAMYEKLLKQDGFSGDNLPHLDECFVSGDTVPLDLKIRFDTRLDPSGKRHFLYEGYGMTETVTAICPMGKEHDKRETSGYPLPGCKAAVLTDGGISLSGEGELLLQANTMMIGYLGRNDSSDFIQDGNEEWLRTGDFGRIDNDGYVTCLGRLKDIIIHNGYNVIPSEVESVLLLAPSVEEACVLGVWDSEKSTERIVAFVVTSGDIATVKSFCETKLPRYAVPAEYHLIGELPRNRMAKVDKLALERLL